MYYSYYTHYWPIRFHTYTKFHVRIILLRFFGGVEYNFGVAVFISTREGLET